MFCIQITIAVKSLFVLAGCVACFSELSLFPGNSILGDGNEAWMKSHNTLARWTCCAL